MMMTVAMMQLGWLAAIAAANGVPSALELSFGLEAGGLLAYEVSVDGRPWLSSAPLRVFAEGAWQASVEPLRT